MARVAVGQADIGLYSTGQKTDPQPNACYFIDVNGLRDPLSNRGFRHQFADGRAIEVQKFVEEDPRIEAIREQVEILVRLNAPSKKWISFAFRDFHGTWIAPAVAELIANSLSNLGFSVSTHHFEIDQLRRKKEPGGAV